MKRKFDSIFDRQKVQIMSTPVDFLKVCRELCEVREHAKEKLSNLPFAIWDSHISVIDYGNNWLLEITRAEMIYFCLQISLCNQWNTLYNTFDTLWTWKLIVKIRQDKRRMTIIKKQRQTLVLGHRGVYSSMTFD